MKNALFIGGTGTISAAISRSIAASDEWTLYLINRGNRPEAVPDGVHVITADINDEAEIARLTDGMHFDCVADFIAFVPEHVERDWRLFRGRTRQYIFISSASAYQKPPQSPFIDEDTPLVNPYWEYSRNKIFCEEALMRHYHDDGFPVTIVRPSHTYDERRIPLGVHGANGSWQIARRMLDGKPVIIHGDGTSLWTMTFNTDFAQGFIGLMAHSDAIGEAFQIMSDEVLTWNQIYQSVADALGVELHAVHITSQALAATGRYDYTGSLLGDKANSVIFNTAKLRSLVPSFKPCVPFREGIRRTVNNVLAHPELQVLDPDFDHFCDTVIALSCGK